MRVLTTLWSGFQFIIVIVTNTFVIMNRFARYSLVVETASLAFTGLFLEPHDSLCWTQKNGLDLRVTQTKRQTFFKVRIIVYWMHRDYLRSPSSSTSKSSALSISNTSAMIIVQFSLINFCRRPKNLDGK